MAFQNLTIDFKSLTKIPIRDRATLAQSNMASEIFGNLTPSQIAALFPDYYKKQLNSLAGQASGFGAEALSTVKSGGRGGGYSGGDSTSSSSSSATAAPAGPPPRPAVIDGILKDAGISVEGAVAPEKIQQSPFFDAIMQAEGTSAEATAKYGFANPFDVVLGYGQYGRPDKPLTEMTIGEMYNFQRNVLLKAPNNNLNSSAAGAFQIVSRNIVQENGDLSVFMKRAGLTLSDRFDENAQRKLAYEIYKEQGLGAWEGLKKNPELWRKAEQYSKNIVIESATDTIQTGTLDGTQPIDSSVPGSDTAVNPLRNDGSTFDPMVLDNLDPRVKDFYMNKATVYEKKALEKAITKLGVNGVNQTTARYPTASPTMVNDKVIGESDRFSVLRGNIEDVDPRLTNLIRSASRDLPPGYTVRAISGKDARSKGTKNHPNGLAMDVQIYNEKGELLKYDGNSEGWKEYEKLYRSIYIRGQDLYPDQKFIWGGAWQSDAAGNGDPMHYQIVDPTVRGTSKTSGRYSFESGLDPSHDFARNTPNNQLTAEERAQYDEVIRAKIIAEKQTLTNPNVTTEPITATTPITGPTNVDPQTGSDVNITPLRQSEAPPVTTATPVDETAPTNLRQPETAPVAEAPAMKLGGDTNVVEEPLSVVNKKTGEEQLSFNPGEEVNIKDGRAEVKNEYKKAAEETEQKTDTGPGIKDEPENQNPNQMRMTTRTPPDRNPWANQIKDAYAPYSPSYERTLKNIKKDRHWERGINGIDVA